MKWYFLILYIEFLCCDLIEIIKYLFVDDEIVMIFSKKKIDLFRLIDWFIIVVFIFFSFFLINVSFIFGSYILLVIGDLWIYCKNFKL